MTSKVAAQIERVKYRLTGRIVIDVVSFAMNTSNIGLRNWDVLGRIRTDVGFKELRHFPSSRFLGATLPIAFQIVDRSHGGAKSEMWYHGDALVTKINIEAGQVDPPIILVRLKGVGPLEMVTT